MIEDINSDLYISLKDPLPISCRVRGVFTRGERITRVALNSLSSLQHMTHMNIKHLNINVTVIRLT